MIENIIDAFLNSLPIFVTVAIILFYREKGMIPVGFKESVGFLLFKLMVPFLTFNVLLGLKFKEEDLPLFLLIFLFELLSLTISFCIAKVLKFSSKQTGALLISTMSFAIGSFAFAFIDLNFSKSVFQIVVVIDIILFILLLIFGPIIATLFDVSETFRLKTVLKGLLKEPLIYIAVTTLLINHLNIEVPQNIVNISGFISRGFTFIVMVYLSLLIKKPNLRWSLLFGLMMLIRIILIVALGLVFIKVFDFSTDVSKAIFLAFIVPFGSFGIMYSDKHKLDSSLIAQTTVATILICMFVYPIVMAVVDRF